MRFNLEKVLNVLLTAAALVVAGTMVKAYAFRPPTPLSSADSRYFPNWRTLAAAGRSTGSGAAQINLVEVLDLECPFCARFNRTVEEVRKRFPDDVAVTYVHFPIGGHRFGIPAARAAECASKEGKFVEMIDLVYRKQDSLGLKAWRSFAEEAGVRSLTRFESCIAGTSTDSRIDAGRQAALAAGVSATPTIILNGWWYGHPPADSELVRAITDLKAGRPPYGEFPKTALR